MRRNVTAAVVQLIGIAAILAGAFSLGWEFGVIAIGSLMVVLGVDLEAGDR